MAVPIRPAANTLELGAPSPLFRVTEPQGLVFYPYDAAADGQRFLTLVPEANAGAAPMTVIVSWQAELKK